MNNIVRRMVLPIAMRPYPHIRRIRRVFAHATETARGREFSASRG
ncbi:MAG: hypothetical protein WA081_02820 [Desulfosalsimonadaceae bacterium]